MVMEAEEKFMKSIFKNDGCEHRPELSDNDCGKVPSMKGLSYGTDRRYIFNEECASQKH